MSIIPFPTPEERIHDIEAGLLSILLSHPERLNDVRGIISAEMFFSLVNRQIYEAIRDACFRGMRLDFRTVINVISDEYFENYAHKKQYISDILTCFANELNAKSYANQIKDFYNRSRIRQITESFIDEHEKASAISELWRSIGQNDIGDFISLQTALSKTLENIDRVYKMGGGFEGLATGLSDLDSVLCGLDEGGLYVLGGRPGMGKTACALSIAMNIARKNNPVLFFSLEMSAEQLMHRVNARYAEIPIWKQKTGADDLNFNDLVNVQKSLQNTPLTIIDRAGLTVEQITAKSHEAITNQRPRLIIVDHLGILAARDKNSPRVYQIGEMTMTLKALAKDIGCPVLLLHQLNRGVEGREDKRPNLSDLRDSGSVEQDADAVMLLYREEYYLKSKEPQEEKLYSAWNERMARCANTAEIIIAKNRQGESKTIKIRFDANRQIFENLE